MTEPEVRETTAGDARALVDALLAAGTDRDLDDGDVLCREGDLSVDAFVIRTGCLIATVGGHGGRVCVATHGPGSVVGEVTTLIGGHRTATLTASGPTVVAVTGQAAVHEVFENHPAGAADVLRQARERTDRSRVAALLSAELQTTDGDAVAAIAERVTWTSLAAGTTLFRRGDPADAAYLVVSGRLGVDIAPAWSQAADACPAPSQDARRDEPVPVSEPIPHRQGRGDAAGPPGDAMSARRLVEIGRGGIVGEFGLLDDRVRSATVVALRDTSLARLDARDFQRISADHTNLAMGLVRRVLDRSGDDHAERSSARTFALAVTADADTDERPTIVRTMSDALDECGTTVVLDVATVDRTLNQPGIADTRTGEFGEVRLAELLHQAESDADHVVLDAGDGCPAHHHDDHEHVLGHWASRSMRHADQVVIICSPNPGADESTRIERLLAATPDRIVTWLAPLHPADCPRPTGSRALRTRFGVDEIIHLRRSSSRDLSRLARLAAGRGVGLVLSGGGARGHAHIGVYRAMCELRVPIDRVVGASMGSIVAGTIAQDLAPDRLLSDMQHGAEKLLDYTLPLVSLVKGERIVNVLERQFAGWEIDDLWIPFSCASTDLTTAEVVVHREGPVATAIRTSVSIPGVLPPVVHGDHLLADGGILDNLPVGVMALDPSIGTIIASDVAPPLGPHAKGDYGLSVSGWAAARERVGPTRLRRRGPRAGYPGVGATLLRAMLIGSSRSRDDHLSSGRVDLYLDLDLRGIGLLDFAQVGPAAARGYESSKPRIAAWLDERGGAVWGDTTSRSAPSDRIG